MGGESKARMTEKSFRQLTSLPRALQLCREHLAERRTDTEVVLLGEALGRVLAGGVRADLPVPHFPRATMDGYAVRASETFSASASAPVLLRLVGGVLIGRAPELMLQPGQTAEIPTGGMLPPGADAVVMLEYAERIGEDTVQVFRPVAPGQNVQQVGEDIAKGAEALLAGARLGSGHIALLAALGKTEVNVRCRPRVGIVSTGDELVPAEAEPAVAQTRDANAPGLAALCERSGAEPVLLGIVPDEPEALLQLAEEALESCDVLVISGGSSAGARDMTREVLQRLGPSGVFVNGVALRPGRPTIIADCAGVLAFGLPGHPVSALIVFHRLVRPVLAWLSGAEPREIPVTARVTRNIPSEAGLTEYVRVRLLREQGQWLAEPLFGKSASVSSLADADGLLEIAAGVEGVVQGEVVPVILWH